MFIKLKASFHFSAVLYGESKVVVLRFSGIMSHLSIWAGVGFIHTTLYIHTAQILQIELARATDRVGKVYKRGLILKCSIVIVTIIVNKFK